MADNNVNVIRISSKTARAAAAKAAKEKLEIKLVTEIDRKLAAAAAYQEKRQILAQRRGQVC